MVPTLPQLQTLKPTPLSFYGILQDKGYKIVIFSTFPQTDEIIVLKFILTNEYYCLYLWASIAKGMSIALLGD